MDIYIKQTNKYINVEWTSPLNKQINILLCNGHLH